MSRRLRKRKKPASPAESRRLEAAVAVVLGLAALAGAVLGARAGSLFVSSFCFLWLVGTVVWFFSIFGVRSSR